MQLTCPTCGQRIPAADADVGTGFARCLPCDEVFRLDALLPPAETPPQDRRPPRAPKPESTRVELATEGERLVVLLPKGGNRAAGCFFLFFSAFWNAITWTFVAVAGIAGGAEDGPPWFVLLFLLPFMLVGIGTALAALYLLAGRTALSVDREEIALVRALFGREWVRRRPSADCLAVEERVAYSQNDQPVHGVGLTFRQGQPWTIGAGLSAEERAWLRYEIDRHLRSLGMLRSTSS